MVENGNKPKGFILIIASLILFLLVIIRLVGLETDQTLKTLGYKDPIVSSTNVRGTIFDRNGKILAIQAPNFGFQVNQINGNLQHMASFISEMTGEDALDIVNLLENEVLFLPLSSVPTKVEREYIRQSIDSTFPEGDLSFTEEETRRYPILQNSPILGIAHDSYSGKGGIEELFNDSLKAIPTTDLTSVYGKSLVLTIDADIQRIMDEQLAEEKFIIFNLNGEIIAERNMETEDVLTNLVYSISDSTNVEIQFTSPLSSYLEKAKENSVFLIYGEDDGVVEKVVAVLRKEGRI